MKSNWIKGIILSITVILTQWFLPWWTFLPVLALGAYWMMPNPFRAFVLGFGGMFLLWAGYAAWLNNGNESLLAGRMGQLFGGMPAVAMVVVSGVIAGLLGGLSAWLGATACGMLARNDG